MLTNEYAEGYPGKRYYGGCDEVDVAEQTAIDRAKELFGAEHARMSEKTRIACTDQPGNALRGRLRGAQEGPVGRQNRRLEGVDASRSGCREIEGGR